MIFILLITVVVGMLAYLLFRMKAKISEINSQTGKPLPVVSANGLFKIIFARLFNRSDANSTVYMQDTFVSLFKETGHPMYCIDFFIFKVVICNDFETIRQVVFSDNCSDRLIDRTFLLRTFNGREQGILSNNGEPLREIRRFTVKALGQLGWNKKSKGIADIIEEQLPELIEHVDSTIASTGNRVPVHYLFSLSVINIVWTVAGGERFTRDDEKFRLLMESSHTVISLTHVDLGIINIFGPLITRFPSFFKYDKVINAIKLQRDYFANLVHERVRKINYDEPPVDFIDTFLHEVHKHKQDPKYSEIYSLEQLSMVMVDFFTAGKDTTSNTLEAALMFMVQYPHVQKKMQEEIERVVGTRLASYSEDRASMPYTIATILEIHRLITVSPIIPRAASNESIINDYCVKQGSWIMANLFALHMDPEFWEDPLIFRPERFLDSNNEIVSEKASHVLPFGGGPRVCIGENVANLTIFNYLTALLQRYHITRGDDNEKLEIRYPVTSRTIPFHVSFSLR